MHWKICYVRFNKSCVLCGASLRGYSAFRDRDSNEYHCLKCHEEFKKNAVKGKSKEEFAAYQRDRRAKIKAAKAMADKPVSVLPPIHPPLPAPPDPPVILENQPELNKLCQEPKPEIKPESDTIPPKASENDPCPGCAYELKQKEPRFCHDCEAFL